MMAAAVAFKCIFSIKDSSLPIIYQNNNQILLNILFDVCHENYSLPMPKHYYLSQRIAVCTCLINNLI